MLYAIDASFEKKNRIIFRFNAGEVYVDSRYLMQKDCVIKAARKRINKKEIENLTDERIDTAIQRIKSQNMKPNDEAKQISLISQKENYDKIYDHIHAVVFDEYLKEESEKEMISICKRFADLADSIIKG